MPHLIVEYSANLSGFPEAQMLAELNQTVTASPEIPDEIELKSRCVAHASYAVGTQTTGRAFVHAQLRLLSGRSPEAKLDFSQRIVAVLRRLTPQPEGVLVQLSVEIVDMDRPSYTKTRL
ncbi:MAG: 5-carboxymethyl-2-hydroxymuconate Delta-isomerase [Burkholderiaceae bacterium]|nr:5-carboxymethyl-2-hydroxymuconate Delta-isomerase [Burkholderiaceae bacterium]